MIDIKIYLGFSRYRSLERLWHSCIDSDFNF